MPGSCFAHLMSPPRFFVDAPLALGASIALPAELAHHAARVLRLRDGAAIVLFNGSGGEFAGELSIANTGASARIVAFDAIEREPPLRVTLIQALVAIDKLDWVIEKSVELGAARIVVAPAERSVVRLQAGRAERRLQHWQAIVRAACGQCGRNRLPTVEYCASLADALAAADAAGPRLLLLPTAGAGLPSITPARHATLAVGPEGGFSPAEAQLAARVGFVGARLGPRILRTETAGLAALAALQALHGDLAADGD